jgi:iron complex outermembrane receptor protein
MTKLFLGTVSPAALLAAMLVPAVAQAQSVETPAAASADVDPNDIVITARKRNESVQTVADPISVITSATIANADLRTLQDAVRLTPNLVVLDGLYPGYKTISFRGFTTLGRDGEFPFATIVDGVVQPGQMFFQQELVNVDQIEVLRGPQGTLYGGGAIAGAINIVTKQPTNDFEGSAYVQYLNGPEGRVGATLTGPLIADKLYFQVGATAYESDGLIPNLAGGRNADFGQGLTTRAALIFTPTDDLRFALSMSSSDSKTGGLWLAAVPDAVFETEIANPTEDEEGIVKTKLRAVSFKVDYEIPDFATLTSITAYSYGRDDTTADGDFSAASSFTQRVLFIDKAWSEELRLTSNGVGPFKWNVGFFYQDEDRRYATKYGNAGTPPNFFSQRDDGRSYKTTALFGQASYALTDRLEVTGGLRWDWESQTLTDNRALTEQKQNFSEPQGKASVSYKFTSDFFGYASYAHGYRKGGFNPRSPVALISYAPETSDNFEVGFKSSFADRLITFNAAAFYTDFKGQQFQTSRVLPGVGIFTAISNIDQTKVMGAEAELSVRPMPGLSFSGSIGYSDVSIEKFVPENPNANNGNVIPQIYGFTGQLGVDYETALVGDFDLAFHGDMSHRGDVYWDVSNSLRTPPKTFFNAKLSLRKDDWTLSAIGRNLSNARTPMAVGAHAYGTSTLASYNQPRQYGVELAVKF